MTEDNINVSLPRALVQALSDACLIALAPAVEQAKPKAYSADMGMGFQAGDYLEMANLDWGKGNAMTADDFARCVAAGARHFRIPANCSVHADEKGVVQEAYMKLMQAQVDMAHAALTDAGFFGYVVLDYNHHNLVRKGDYSLESLWPAAVRTLNETQHAARDTTSALQVAERFKDYGRWLSFDPFNEPGQANQRPATPGLTAAELNTWHADLVPKIRAISPDRMIWLEPWAGKLASLTIPPGGNIGVSPHAYVPFGYTHGTDALTDFSLTQYVAYIRFAKDWAAEKGVDLWVGEAGVKASKSNRNEWLSHMRRTHDAEGVPYCVWDYASLFGSYDRGAKAWRAGALDALAGKTPVRDFLQPKVVGPATGRVLNRAGAPSYVTMQGDVLTVAANTGKTSRTFSVLFPDVPAATWATVEPEVVTPIKFGTFAFAKGVTPDQDAPVKIKANGAYLSSGGKGEGGVPFIFPALQDGAVVGFQAEQPAGCPAVTVRMRDKAVAS